MPERDSFTSVRTPISSSVSVEAAKKSSSSPEHIRTVSRFAEIEITFTETYLGRMRPTSGNLPSSNGPRGRTSARTTGIVRTAASKDKTNRFIYRFGFRFG